MATGPVKPSISTNPIATTSGADRASDAKKASKSESAGLGQKAGSAGTKGNYDVQISSQAKEKAELQKKLFEAAKNSPDVREDRVAALKKQIAEGTYKMDTGAIADGMLRESIRDHLAMSEK